MTTLIIDGHNFLHRARSGFTKGEYNIVFNCFRNLRALVEQFQKSHSINRVLFVLEGHPKFRYDLLESYKANRRCNENDPKYATLKDFHRQKHIVVDLLSNYFPISVMKHPDYECDDIIYNIINNAARSSQFVVVSNDSDFVQLLNKFDNVQLYNPMQKCFVENTMYDYVSWKSLVGDGSDNIPGVKHGLGDKTAQGLLESPEKLQRFFQDEPECFELYSRNKKLITFAQLPSEELMCVTCSNPQHNWDYVKIEFDKYQFASITKESSWSKFVQTFDKLWNV